MIVGLSKNQIELLFAALNTELRQEDTKGELYLMGGAVMCLVYDARASTHDVDALFKPSKKVREAAARAALKLGIDEHWLNDGVKGFLSDTGSFTSYLELSHLKVMVAQAEYLLAMKCLSMRIGEEFHDIDDIQYLLRYLNISDFNTALDIIAQYYPLERFPQKTLYALEEICQGK
jgi:hypothetical protein